MEAFDDDFGELYADVEVQTTAAVNGMSDFARLYLGPEQENDLKADSAKLEDDFVADAKKVDTASGESTHSGSENSEFCSGKEVDGSVGSDSEDDLNIVLNDEDCKAFSVGNVRNGGVVTGVGYGEDDDDDDLGMNGKCGDQVAGGLELVSSNGHAGQNGNGVNVAYSSQFFHHKFVRTRGSTFLNNKKVSKTGALSSYCSPLINGRWNGNPCVYNQTAFAAANPMAVQCGYGLFLPRHWSIFDVNFDTLEEKPWKIPGVDITDYFNFGFDENSWKQYCESLREIWQESVQSGIPVNEYLKMNPKAMREQIDPAVSENILSPLSESEVPKGKAIQVEDSIGERQPSMDVRHPRSRNRDSDVVIEIKLESPGDCSGSGNSNVHEPSEDGEFSANNNRNIVSSGSEYCGVLFKEHLEELKRSDDSSVHERNDLFPSVDKGIDHQYQTVQCLEDTADDASEREIQAEKGVGIDTYSADPCLIEAELSLGDQELSLTSYSDSDSKATENSVHVKHEKQHSPLRRRSLNFVTKSRESTPSFQKNLKNNRDSVNMDYYSRDEGQIRKEQKHRSGRHERGSKLNKLSEHDNDVSSIHISGARDVPVLDHELIDYDRQKERLRGFVCSERRKFSDYNYKEAEQSCHYGGENFADDLTNTVYTKYSYRKGHDSFRENINRYAMRNWDQREYLFEQRTLMADNEDGERDWYEANAGYSGDDLSPPSYRESRQFLSKHFDFPAKERDTERRRMHGKPHFRHRNCDNDHWFDDSEHEFINNSCRMSSSFTQRGTKYERQFPHVDGELKRVARRGRHHDRDLDSFWSVRMEDECHKYTHHRTLNSRYYRESLTDSLRNYVYDPRTNENFVRHRHKHTRDDRGTDWYYGYDDDAEDEDYIIDPVNECEVGRRRYSSPSEVLHWTDDGVIHRYHQEVDAEMATFPYEETSRYERSCARYGSLHDEVKIEDVQIQQHRLNMFRIGSDNCIKRSSKIIYRGKHEQASLSCRNSVDLVDEEGKSWGRSSRARRHIYNGRLENLDEGIAKKRTAVLKFDEFHKKAIKSDISKSKVEYNRRKWLQNIPDEGHKEGLDIEEGQIVTEEPCKETFVTRRDVSERAALTGSVKKRMLQKKNNSDQDNNKAGYDNQRILEMLAKMEKRRERFKEPIAMKKEAEESSKLNDDLVVDTDEIKQHRPARKRRWGGS